MIQKKMMKREVKMETYNSFKITQQQLIEASKLLNLDHSTIDLLSWPQKEFKFTLPVKMDNG